MRVTTEPIIDPASREAQAWIEEEDENDIGMSFKENLSNPILYLV